MLGLFALLLHAMPLAPNPSASTRPVLTVSVALDGRLDLEQALLADVALRAHDIWRPYADLAFRMPGDGSPTGHGDDLTLVMTNRRSSSGGDSLGWVEFVDGRPTTHLIVSLSAVRALLEASEWMGLPAAKWPRTAWRTFLVRALGRAVAHEVGHYLLASRSHATGGLMRASFTAADVMRPRPADDRLGRAEIKRLSDRQVA